ncbi:MAG: FAD-dependent oxidoreductase [Polyangiaceae bacterium]|nr:FAD-dependent oxidoreductase [Polyangiaceae bacterium]
MGLLRRSEGARELRPRPSLAPSALASRLRPQPVTKASPCSTVCLAGNDVRGVLAVLAQREKLGLSEEEALDRAWHLLVETNPFPATIGRICPHPCETSCNRQTKDGSVAIAAVERFVGDWGLERGLRLPVSPDQPERAQRIAIVGAGPAGLSCAYQLARRGYGSTLFESMPEPGGMLRYGVPPYRLPNRVLMGEAQRVLALRGVELCTGVKIGSDLTLEQLRHDYAAVFIGPGAGASRTLSIPGVAGSGVHQAVSFLRDVARGVRIELGREVVVVGGGDTAIDAARVALRLLGRGAAVTLLRVENVNTSEELAEAIDEGVRVEFLARLSSVVRDTTGKMVRALAQRVALGPRDLTGFPTLVAVPDGSFEMDADSVILALGQKPDVRSLVEHDDGCLEADDAGKTRLPGVWRGGDAVRPSFAAVVINQGRQAALSIAAELEGVPRADRTRLPELKPERLKLDCYEPRPRLERRLIPVTARVADLLTEVDPGHDRTEALAEAARCLSCGSCYGCERCWMYCTPGCMKRSPSASPGRYFTIQLDTCDGCKKCSEECPCGYLDMT